MGAEALAAGRGDAVAFGKAFISNPDLVGGSHAYADYPTLAAAKAA